MTLTPERLAMIREVVDRSPDPYWRGYLAAVADLTQPPESPGASSCPTLAQRKDTP